MAEWTVPDDEIQFRFVASGGPGGQHANRSNTKVEATFVVGDSSMPDSMKGRVRRRLGDTVRVVADDERSQHRNRQLAADRLRRRVADAAVVPRARRATRPSKGSKRRRLDAKRRRGDLKRQRRSPRLDD